MQPTRSPSSSAIHAASASAVHTFTEVGDDPGDERLEAWHPSRARLRIGHRAVRPPSRGRRARGDVARGRRHGALAVEHPPDPPHRRRRVRCADLRRAAQRADRSRPPAACPVSVERPPPCVGEADQLATRIGCRRFPLDESVGDEPGQDPAQVAGVQIEVASQFRHCQSGRRVPVRTARGPRSARMPNRPASAASRPRMRV